MDHLKARAMLEEEELLKVSLKFIGNNPERLKYYIQGSKVYMSTATNSLESRYEREFLSSMLLEQYRWMFIDFKPHLMALISGKVPITSEIFLDLQEIWGLEACNNLIDNIIMFQALPVTIDFDWQILGTTKFSIETIDSMNNITLPLIVLDYLWRLPSEDVICET